MTGERLVEAILDELAPAGMRLELGPFRALLEALGDPQRGLPVVLVAGTNGKGSVSGLLASVARAAGLRVGLYTSPHLQSWCERIRIGGVEVAPARLADLLSSVVERARSHRLPAPTPFEAMTAAAFVEFRAAAVDLAVLEVGLGGRLDATNLAEPILTVVARIALDHRAELGESLTAIAREKAGILRPTIPLVLAPQDDEADSALRSEAANIGAPVHAVGEESRPVDTEWLGLDGWRVVLRTPRGEQSLNLRLAGEHQLDNLATAVCAAELLAPRFASIDVTAVAKGVEEFSWPGRLELVRLAGRRPPVLFDAAHNPDGCAALARFLGRLDVPFDLVFGCLADKDARSMLAPLAQRPRCLFLTRPSSPRALAAKTLAEIASEYRQAAVFVEPDPAAALDAALDGAAELVVVAGSIYLVGALRALALGTLPSS